MKTVTVPAGAMQRPTVFLTDAQYAALHNREPLRIRWDVPRLKAPGIWASRPGSGRGRVNKLRGFFDPRKA